MQAIGSPWVYPWIYPYISMDIPMDIHKQICGYGMDVDMDVKFHIHGKPVFSQGRVTSRPTV